MDGCMFMVYSINEYVVYTQYAIHSMMKLTQKALPKPLNKKICNEAFTTSAVVKSQPLEHATYRGFSCFHSLLLTLFLSCSLSLSIEKKKKNTDNIYI